MEDGKVKIAFKKSQKKRLKGRLSFRIERECARDRESGEDTQGNTVPVANKIKELLLEIVKRRLRY